MMALPEDLQQKKLSETSRRAERHRRVVSKGVFVRTIGKKVGLFSLSGFILGAGLVLTLCTLICLYFSVALLALFFGALTVGAFWYSTRVFVQAKEVEAVRPVTQRTAHLLPPEESLVRASDAPHAHLKSELLRAAQSGQDTPVEELLRGASVNGQET